MTLEGVMVRQLHHRAVWLVPPAVILKYAHKQIEMFSEKEMGCEKPMDQSIKEATVPSVPEAGLVPVAPGSGVVHEGGERPPESPQVGGNGLPAQAESEDFDSASPAPHTNPGS